jgi:hypothetical protein
MKIQRRYPDLVWHLFVEGRGQRRRQDRTRSMVMYIMEVD